MIIYGFQTGRHLCHTTYNDHLWFPNGTTSMSYNDHLRFPKFQYSIVCNGSQKVPLRMMSNAYHLPSEYRGKRERWQIGYSWGKQRHFRCIRFRHKQDNMKVFEARSLNVLLSRRREGYWMTELFNLLLRLIIIKRRLKRDMCWSHFYVVLQARFAIVPCYWS